MSLSDTPAYAEESDVQAAMQEVDAAFGDTPLGTTNVEAAIFSASRWFRRRAQAHFYDSNAAASDLISDSAVSESNIQMSCPSSPHPQNGQLFKNNEGALRERKYPQTNQGAYCRLKQQVGSPGLPYRYVKSIERLAVRELGGDQSDWVDDKDEGRGEDYYTVVAGGDDYGRSYLFIHAGSLGARLSFEGVAEVDLTHGRDWQDDPWADVRRGIGHLAAAELVVDDEVLTQIPDSGAIANVETQAQQHLNAAMDRYLGGYLGSNIA